MFCVCSAHICSLSNYDSGFILDALAEMGHIDYGTAMLRLCWGKQLSAGSSCWWESTAFYDGMLSGESLSISYCASADVLCISRCVTAQQVLSARLLGLDMHQRDR